MRTSSSASRRATAFVADANASFAPRPRAREVTQLANGPVPAICRGVAEQSTPVQRRGLPVGDTHTDLAVLGEPNPSLTWQRGSTATDDLAPRS